MKVKVIVTPKETVLDPQGAAVREAMQHLGFSGARDVRIGRYLEIELEGDPAAQEPKLRELCHDLLSNPVIEDYRLEMPNETEMKFAIVQFPGSNCDQDCLAALRGIDGIESDYVWHKETSLVVGTRLCCRAGFPTAIICAAGDRPLFADHALGRARGATGKLVIGICNGFQILCEAGLLPGALVRNRSLHFVCDMVTTRVEVTDSPFTCGMPVGTLLRLPVAHGEGCYYADERTLSELNERQQVLLRYCDETGRVVPAANPNGSVENIAGICNREGNVFGLMPHPDRACEERLGSSDGARIFESMLRSLAADRAAA